MGSTCRDRGGEHMQRVVKAVGYVRVSTVEQAQEGVSLDAQEAKIRAYCEVRDWTLLRIIRDEGVSAGDLDRPGMVELLTMIRKRECGAVVVWKLDRLVRSVRDLGTVLDTLKDKDIELASVTEHFDTSNAVGRLMLHLLVSVAQWERETVGERTRATLQYLKSSLRPYGREPFGFMRADGDRLIPYAKEAKVVKQIFQWRGQGESYFRISRWLNTKKVATKTGDGQWYPSTVRYMLRNKTLYQPLLASPDEAAAKNRVQAGSAAKPGVKRP